MGKSNISFTFIFYQKWHCKVCLYSIMIDIAIEIFMFKMDDELLIAYEGKEN